MSLHLSVDDTFEILYSIYEKGLKNIFEEPSLQFFEDLHKRYGVSVSFYCFMEKDGKSLRDIHFSQEIKDQFVANSYWLKFGFHDRNYETNYGSSKFTDGNIVTDYDTAFKDCKEVVDFIRENLGENSIDFYPRIHYFAGTRECCRAFKDCGMKGFLSADDERISYYLTKEQNDQLLREHSYFDQEEGLKFIQTNIRLEKVDQIPNVDSSHVEVFTHQCFLQDEAIKQKFVDSCIKF